MNCEHIQSNPMHYDDLEGVCIYCWKARTEKAEAELDAYKKRMESSENDFIDEHNARVEAEAACAELVNAINVANVSDDKCSDEDWKIIEHALSLNCGKGWLSPEEAMDLQVQLVGWERAANMLREGMGLDASKTDLRECLLTFDAIKAKLAIAVDAFDAAIQHLCDAGQGKHYDPSWSRPRRISVSDMQACCEQAYHVMHNALSKLK